MMFKKIAAAAALVACVPAFAAIAPATTGNGELFLAVADATAKISYTLDLGVTQNDWLAVAQSDAGYSRQWALTGDANFATFLSLVDAANLKWVVGANEFVGAGATPGAFRTFTTVTVGQEAIVPTWTNQQYQNGTGATYNSFVTNVNATGTHVPSNNYAVNGSSVNRETDSGKTYFGEAGGFTPNFNNTAPFTNTNEVNVASTFVYLTRSSGDQLGKVQVDVFDNAAGALGLFTLERNAAGDYRLDYSISNVPEPGSYALMVAGLAAMGFVSRRRRAGR